MVTLMGYLCVALELAALLVFMAQLWPSRLTAWKIAAVSLGYALLRLPQLALEGGAAAPLWLETAMLIALCPAVMAAYRGSRAGRIAGLVCFYALRLACGRAARALSLYPGPPQAGPDLWAHPMVCLVLAATLYISAGSALVLAWRMIRGKALPITLLLLILPIGQMVMVYSFLFTTWTPWWLLGVFMSLLADLILLTYAISQEKKADLEEALAETRHRLELEQFHHSEAIRRREALAKIQFGFHEQLAAVSQLIDSGDAAPAQALIRSISDEINSTQVFSYRATPVVNAVLTEKARVCREADISLQVELDLPSGLSIEPVHLCSVFSNLLDNAIAACKQLPRGEPPSIRLSSRLDGDYLFVKTVNPAPRPPAGPVAGRGYGTRILSDLAARYGGGYMGEYREGVFTAVTSLLAVEP